MKELIEKYQKVPVIEYKNKIKKGAVVSVCVQTYNHVNFIKENLEGILMQKTNFPIEILLGEDESNDGTREICMEYAGKYSEKIRLFLHSRVNNIEINGQPTGRFNLLYNLSKAQGKYVAFCEGDDYWTDPYKLQKQVHFMEANEDFAICHHNMQVIYEEKNKERHLSNPPDGNEVTTIEDLAYGNYIFTASCVFRNNLFGEFPDWYAECPIGDYPLHMLNAQFGRIRYIPEVMGGYRVHKGGVWESKDSIYRKNKWVYMLDLMKNQFSTNINKQLTEQQIIVYEDLIHLLGNQPGQCRQYSNKILENDPFYLSNLRSENSRLSAVVNQKNQELNQKNQELNQKNQELNQKNQELNQKDIEIHQKSQELIDITSSISWRITKFFRTRIPFITSLLRLLHFINSKVFQNQHLSAHSIAGGPADRNNYTEWIQRYDTLSAQDGIQIKSKIDKLSKPPLISVLMPVYNPNPEWLIEAIHSVCDQVYPHWELCIADDASTDCKIRPILERYAEKDERIKVVFREKNGHISACSNSALEIASGEWVALFDHDDKLAEHALFWVADAINRNPSAKLLYSDEDKINKKGIRSEPYFKSDWNLDLFYSQNMFCHLGVYNTKLLKKIGGFRKGVEGSQDYDLVLRCIEHIDSKQIIHIPRVLYHWRIHKDSTAKSGDTKPYAFVAGQKALNEHFNRKGMDAHAELLQNLKSYRIRYTLPDKPPLVSLIILTKNKLPLLKTCVGSILKKTAYQNYEILIIDNGSDEQKTIQYLKDIQSIPKIRVIRDDRKFNFSVLNNAAVKLAQGEIIGLLNNDIEVISPEWLSEMVSHALRPEVGAVGAKLWYPNDLLQHGGVVLGIGGVAGHSHLNLPRGQHGYFNRADLIQNFSAVTAACLIIKKSIYDEVGGLNEDNLQIAFNDIDFCLRIYKMGYRNVWTPFAELYHHESASRGYEDTPEKQNRFSSEVNYMQQQWGELLLNDPAYNPNLTLLYGDYSLAWPPRV